LVDEVLAVGDAEFQKKCLGKMDDVARREGRTVVLVSRNMEAVLKHCRRGILVDGGSVVLTDNVQNVVSSYLAGQLVSSITVDLSDKGRIDGLLGKARLTEVVRTDNKQSWSVPFGENLSFEVTAHSLIEMEDIELGIALGSARGFEVATWTNRCAATHLCLRPGANTFKIEYEGISLLPGQYFLGFWIRSSRGIEDHIPEAVQFEVVPNSMAARINAHSFAGVLVPTAKASILKFREIEAKV
jgi:lipopolysaccharide transport system ATP-binding protein